MSQLQDDSSQDTARTRAPIEVFYSYSHKDEEFLEKLIGMAERLPRRRVLTCV
jgi:hypothetical protein